MPLKETLCVWLARTAKAPTPASPTGTPPAAPPAKVSPGLEKLAELTHALPELLLKYRKYPGLIDYAVSSGRCSGVGLLNIKEIAVQMATMPAGSVLPGHLHPDSIEVFVIVSGALQVEYQGLTKVYRRGEVTMLPPQTVHMVSAIEDTWMLAVTMPAIEGYPDVAE